ncbi:MAG TPA: FtsQ-type POTRA domain-containing protein [Candidatus Dormibacteraeota bacterium]|nr:FtsQ-type POTRA domain-containing protein [Candidatus Dormibacteraeota bacterium]
MRAAAVATLKQLPRVRLTIPPRIRRWLLFSLVLALMLLSAYRFWFRDSGFVRVEHVTVTGLTTKDAPRIRLALTAAARDMTTLNVQQKALDSAVAGFPIVKEVVATRDFPHGLRIRVIEERPVATLVVNGQRLLIAPDGTVLRGIDPPSHSIAVIRTRTSVPQDRVSEGAPLSALHVAASAPHALAVRISSIGHAGDRGLVARLRAGPLLIFGNDSDVAAKWAAAAAVLADPSSKGASYLDLRVPDRPVAGGLAASTLAPLSATGNDTSAQSNITQDPATTAPSTTNPTPDTPDPTTDSNPQP